MRSLTAIFVGLVVLPGFVPLATCSFWDPSRAAAPDVARYQCVFQRRE